MAHTSTYPKTLYEPSPRIDLTSSGELERISPAAVRTFFKIMEHWKVRDAEVRLLLGGVSNGRYYAMKKKRDGRLDADRLIRISYLVGIFKALNILYSERLADEWIQLPNSNRIFAGQTPLNYMINGGQPAMQTVRRLLDARRGGA
jgi:hypothetical protein